LNAAKNQKGTASGPRPLNFSDETDELASLTNRVTKDGKNIAAAKKSRYFAASQQRACIAIR
jgi:hypothetical protein